MMQARGWRLGLGSPSEHLLEQHQGDEELEVLVDDEGNEVNEQGDPVGEDGEPLVWASSLGRYMRAGERR